MVLISKPQSIKYNHPVAKLADNIYIQAVASAAIWVVIALLTGGPALFVVVGALFCALATFAISQGIHRIVFSSQRFAKHGDCRGA